MKRVEVYWNFRRKLFSVRSLEGSDKGRVIDRVNAIILSNVEFKVSEAGRQRVLRDQRKNVHAVIRGEWQGDYPDAIMSNTVSEVKYNPYRDKTFVLNTGEAIYRAVAVMCEVNQRGREPKVWAAVL